jgi:hypothetical protein
MTYTFFMHDQPIFEQAADRMIFPGKIGPGIMLHFSRWMIALDSPP